MFGHYASFVAFGPKNLDSPYPHVYGRRKAKSPAMLLRALAERVLQVSYERLPPAVAMMRKAASSTRQV
jgi:hypothetical protein